MLKHLENLAAGNEMSPVISWRTERQVVKGSVVVRVAEHQPLTLSERTPLFLRIPQNLKMGGPVSKKEEEPDPRLSWTPT